MTLPLIPDPTRKRRDFLFGGKFGSVNFRSRRCGIHRSPSVALVRRIDMGYNSQLFKLSHKALRLRNRTHGNSARLPFKIASVISFASFSPKPEAACNVLVHATFWNPSVQTIIFTLGISCDLSVYTV
jgi:hypothetical protein